MPRSPSPAPRTPADVLGSPAAPLREDDDSGLLGGTANSLLLGASCVGGDDDDDEPSPPARSTEDRELPPLAASPARVAFIRRRLEGVVVSAATSGPNSGTTSRGTGSTPAAAGVRDPPSRSHSPMVPVGLDAGEETPQGLRRVTTHQAAPAVSFEADDGIETDDGDGAATEHGRPRRTRSVSYVDEDRLPPHAARSIDGAAPLTSLVGHAFELSDWAAAATDDTDGAGNSGTFGRAALSEVLESGQPSPMSRHARRFASASRTSEGLGLSLSGHSQLASLLNTPHASFASPSLGPHGLPPLNTTGPGNSGFSSAVASPDAIQARASSLGSFFTSSGAAPPPHPAAAAHVSSDASSPRQDSTRPSCLELSFTPQHRSRPDGPNPPPLAGISGDGAIASRQSTDVEGPFFVGRGFRSAGPPTPNAPGHRSASPGATSPVADMPHRMQIARRSPSVGDPARSPGHRSYAASPTSRLPPAGAPVSQPRRRAGTYTTGQGGGSPSSMPVLVLDLDRTLVATDWVDGICGRGDFRITYDKRKVAVDMRPRLCSFLQRMAAHYRLAIFTATDVKYAKPIVRQIESRAEVKFEMLFCKDSCERRDATSSTAGRAAGDEQDNSQPFVDTPGDAAATRGPRTVFVKNLRVVGVPMSRVLLLDDKSSSFSDQPRNGVRIAPYRRPDTSDQELDAMAALLEKVAASAFRDVRDALEAVRRTAIPVSPPGGALRSVASFGTYPRAGDSPSAALQQHHAHSSGSLFGRQPTFARARPRSLSIRSDTGAEVADHVPSGAGGLHRQHHTPAATVVPPTALHPARPSSASGGSSAVAAASAGLNATYPASSTTPVPSAGPLNLSFGTVNNMSFDWPHSQQQANAPGPVSPSQRPSPQQHRTPVPRLSYSEYDH